MTTTGSQLSMKEMKRLLEDAENEIDIRNNASYSDMLESWIYNRKERSACLRACSDKSARGTLVISEGDVTEEYKYVKVKVGKGEKLRTETEVYEALAKKAMKRSKFLSIRQIYDYYRD